MPPLKIHSPRGKRIHQNEPPSLLPGMAEMFPNLLIQRSLCHQRVREWNETSGKFAVDCQKCKKRIQKEQANDS